MNKNTINLFNDIIATVAPPKPLTISQWADEYRMLPQEGAAEYGKWDTDRAPYQREMMDAISDPKTERVVIMSSAQVGKTELCLNIVGYYIHHEPSPLMYVMPQLDLAKIFAKSRLATMIRDTKVLRDLISDEKLRDGKNNTLEKIFPGGYLKLVGANSEASLRSMPIKVVLMDEVDAFPKRAGEGGDPVKLAIKRTNNFWNRKIVMISTPLIKDDSRIEEEYNKSTMEVWNLKCPHCGEYQPIEWDYINKEDATMTCMNCGSVADEFEWKVGKGKWLARYPERKVRGFHLNEFASPWRRWTQIIDDYNDSKDDPKQLRTWWNTALGLPYEEVKEKLDSQIIEDRREVYEAQVPDGALVLTAGVDTQDNRLECEVVGWGVGEESWGIEYKSFYGDPAQNAVWDQLDDYLQSTFRFADGSGIKISCACVDSGGHHTKKVYDFTKAREHRRIYSIKGKGGPGIPLVHSTTRTKRNNAILFILGVDDGKETLQSRLKLENIGGANEGYCHFPMGDEGQYIKGYTQDYFKGLTSEQQVEEMTKRGVKRYWKKVKSNVRNEALDCRNYAQAAIQIFNPNFEELKRQGVTGNKYEQKVPRKKRRVLSKGL